MKKKNLLFVLAGLFLLVSCSNSEDDTAANQGKAIEFRSVVDKTKASLVGNTDQLESFFVKGQEVSATTSVCTEYLSASVYKNASDWTYSPQKYWPVNDDVVNFYAFAPYSDAIRTSLDVTADVADVKFSYTVPVNQSVQNTAVDLLVASKLDRKGSVTPTSPVALTFKHALSAVTFSAKNKNATTSELVYTISKIEIVNLDNTGDYTYSTEAWTENDTYDKTYIAGVPASGVAVQPVGDVGAAVRLLSANDVLIVLPQEVDVTTKVKITYSLKDGAGAYIYQDAERELVFPVTFDEFDAGKRYNFVFEFLASNAITFSVTAVTDWGDDEDVEE
ncbi:MAG: fimbrillin family protein [Prevotella sp.]|jgi:hypothetical protein|nr:fimbrillin family protein [Prevotella sp.]